MTNPSEVSETRFRDDVEEAASLLGEFARTLSTVPFQSTRIRNAAAALGWNYARAKSIFYAEARRIDGREMDQLRTVSIVSEMTGTPRNDDRNRLRKLAADIAATQAELDRLRAERARLRSLSNVGRGGARGGLPIFLGARGHDFPAAAD